MLHGGGLVAGDARVVAVVVGRQVVDAQRAGEVDVVHRHAQTDRDWPAVLLPRDVERPVARHHHAGDEDALADGEALELKGLDVGWDWGDRSEGSEVERRTSQSVRTRWNILYFCGRSSLETQRDKGTTLRRPCSGATEAKSGSVLI